MLIFQWYKWKYDGPDLPLRRPVRHPEIPPLAIGEMPEGAKEDGGSEIMESGASPISRQRLSRRTRALHWRRLRAL